MKNHLLLLAASACLALSLPAALPAQPPVPWRHDVRHDRRDIRQDRRELRYDLRTGRLYRAAAAARDLRYDLRDLRCDRWSR